MPEHAKCTDSRPDPRIVVLAFALAAVIGCAGQDARLTQHQEKFESLGATAVAVGEAWLHGAASGVYARAALEDTFALVEQERAAMASPATLVDARAADLSQRAERLARLVALLADDIRTTNAASVRRRLTDVPFRPSPRP